MDLLIAFIVIIFTHFFADFVFQTQEMSMNKSKSNYWLTKHVATYVFVFLIASLVWRISTGQLVELSHESLAFLLITFATHWIIDYVTSRQTSKLYAKGDYHNFFVVIGFDQALHMTQLFLTYYLLFA